MKNMSQKTRLIHFKTVKLTKTKESQKNADKENLRRQDK